MKANKVQKWSIMLRSAGITLWSSIVVLFRHWTGRLTREWFDGYRVRWARRLLACVKVNYHITNPHQVKIDDEHSYVIMSNHASHYDIPLLFVTFPKGLRMIAKKELFKVPVWGPAMKSGEIMVIDRQDRRQAIKDLAVVKEKMASGIIPWIAPEGTRTRTGKLEPFKKGGFMIALETGATIIPVGIKGSGAILPPATWEFGVKESVEINIGKTIDASQYTRKQRDQLMHDVEAAIRELVDEPFPQGEQAPESMTTETARS